MNAFFSEIINGNNAVTALAILAIYLMHRSANEKLDDLTSAVNKVGLELAVGRERTLNLEAKVKQVEEANKAVSSRLHETNQQCLINKNDIRNLKKL